MKRLLLLTVITFALVGCAQKGCSTPSNFIINLMEKEDKNDVRG